MKLSKILALSLSIFLCLPAAWAVGETLPLPALVDSVLTQNAGLQAAEAQVRQNEAALREARSLRLPSLSAQSTFTRGDQPVYAFGSLLNQGRFGPSDLRLTSSITRAISTTFKAG